MQSPSELPDANQIQTAVNDPERLRVVRSVADPSRQQNEALQKLSQKASQLLDAPLALISLVEADTDMIYGQVGLPEELAAKGQIDASPSFCQLTVAGNRTVVVEDAREVPTLRLFPSVAKQGVRAHLGIPLRVNGQAIGNCCVIDFKPRQWTKEQIDALTELANEALGEIASGSVPMSDFRHRLSPDESH